MNRIWTVSTGDDQIDFVSLPTIAENWIGKFDDPVTWYVASILHRKSILFVETRYYYCAVALLSRWVASNLKVIQNCRTPENSVLPKFQSHVLVV